VRAYRLLLEDLLKRLGWRFPVLVAWTALAGLSEGASIVLLLPVLNRIGIAAAVNQGALITVIERGLTRIGAITTAEILLIVIATATVQLALSLGLNSWMVRVARCYQSQRQLELFAAFMSAKWIFLTDWRAGELTAAIVAECERLGRAFTLSLSLLGSAIIAVIYIVLSVLIAWPATLSVIGLAAFSALGMFSMYGKSYAAGEKLAPLNARLQSFLDERFAGAKFVKASAGVERAVGQLGPLLRELEDANTTATAMPGTVRGILEYVGLIGVAIILVLATNGFGMAPANVVIVLALFGRLFPRITTVQSQLHSLNNNVHAVEVINKLQAAADAARERQDAPDEQAALKIGVPATLAIRSLEVKFGEHKALADVDLRLPIPGLVAVVGGSGAGKSTLVHTLLGLTEPSNGSIALGNHDFASTSLAAWRRAIGYVPQETILFHASIKDNLTFAKPDASEIEIEMAARRAHAHDFIVALPEGYDAIIGDQGVKLSGGQRQRLGIARALLVNPLLLILDEAMSALDAVSEIEILRTLEELRKEIGILVIAHRLAAVGSADSIYVLEDGQIVENGTWEALIGRRGRLYALAAAQGLDRVAANAG
jgi:ATP-binding cassette, subfamily C, bacterial